jgi:copper chaperone CopZ
MRNVNKKEIRPRLMIVERNVVEKNKKKYLDGYSFYLAKFEYSGEIDDIKEFIKKIKGKKVVSAKVRRQKNLLGAFIDITFEGDRIKKLNK